MLDFDSILDLSCTKTVNSIISKKRALQQASEMLHHRHPELDERKLFDQLMEREHLGSTGLGDGIAIPHCRMDDFGLITGAMLSLNTPIEFEAQDGGPVDLIFVLVVPTQAQDTHLQILSSLAAVLGNVDSRSYLREAFSDKDLHARMLSLIDDVQANR